MEAGGIEPAPRYGLPRVFLGQSPSKRRDLSPIGPIGPFGLAYLFLTKTAPGASYAQSGPFLKP
jgi:hypothetical protein